MDQGPLSVSINVMLLLSADLCWDHKCWSCHMQPQCRPLRHPKYPKSKTLVTHVLHDLTSTSESKDRSCVQISGLPGMKLWHHTSHFRRNHGKLRVWPRDAKGPELNDNIEICRSRPHRAPRRGCASDLTMRLLRFATCLSPCYREPPAVSSHL